MNKLTALFNLFRKGQIVANPEAWKKGQITVNVLSAVILAVIGVLQAFSVTHPTIMPIIAYIQLNTESIAGIIILINGLFNPVATVVSSTKVGLPPRNQDSGGGKSPLTGY